jgi:hypothetical protein
MEANNTTSHISGLQFDLAFQGQTLKTFMKVATFVMMGIIELKPGR